MGFGILAATFLALCLLKPHHRCETGGQGQQGSFEGPEGPPHTTPFRHHGESRKTRSHPTDWKTDRFPYMCSILRTGSRDHICSGFLIRPEWVITAASCVDPAIHVLGLDALVYCGAYNEDDSERTKLFVPKATMHPSWTGDFGNGFDVALLRLDRKTGLTRPRINEREVFLSSGTLLTALEKVNETQGDQLDNLSISMGLPYITPKDCQGRVPFNLKYHMICVDVDKNGTLKGDVGGSLLIPDREESIVDGFADLDFVLGIASGRTESSSNSTAVYTSIAHFRKWIEHVIDGKPLSSEELVKPTPVFKASRRDLYADLSGEKLESVLKEVVANLKSHDAFAVRRFLGEKLNSDSVYGSFGYTLLHWAAQYNASNCIEALIEFGAHVERRNKKGKTPLGVAAYKGSLLAAKVLVTLGAEIDAPDNKKNTPMIVACYEHHWDIAEFLISKGANIEAKCYSCYQWTAMHFAANYQRPHLIKYLISKGAKVEEKDTDGWTPLYAASRRACRRGDSYVVDTVKALLAAGASTKSKDKNGKRPYDVVCLDCSCSVALKKQLKDLLKPKSSTAQ